MSEPSQTPTPITSAPVTWTDLTLREKNVLEHLTGIFSGLAQTLRIECGQPVMVEAVDTHRKTVLRPLGTPDPTDHEVRRMRDFCLANQDELTIIEHSGDHILVRGIDLS